MKRIFDVCASLAGLIFLLPVFLFIAVWIKLDSSGPVFFRQVRVGQSGKEFRIHKFRSMRSDSEAKGKLTVGSRDSRVTRSGHFIRKYKLDELPQLIDVLKGDMSLVGPRPEVPEFIACYEPEMKEKVLSVRPGITDNASILTGLLIELDRKCDAELSRHILNEQPKDRLFEAFMVRFDVLNDDREAWKSLFFDVLKNPAYLKVATARFHHSMNVMLRICDLTDRKGPALSAPFKSGAIALVYLNAIRIWLNDDTPDMSQTMAELDRGLTRLDSIVAGLPSILQGWVS